jgi:hypothetical protein
MVKEKEPYAHSFIHSFIHLHRWMEGMPWNGNVMEWDGWMPCNAMQWMHAMQCNAMDDCHAMQWMNAMPCNG